MQKIPATVITGFLGAGKTSLIRHLLTQANGRRIALVINEFGELGIDGEILRGCGIEGCADEDVIELANGCICCTVADDFLPTIEKLLGRPESPDHIVIETSGLALPKPLLKAFNWPDVRTRVTVDGVIAVVDAPAIAAGQFAHDVEAVQSQRAADEALDHDSPLEELYEDQLSSADMVIVNKTDLIDPSSLRDILEQLRTKVRPAVKLVEARFGRVDATLLLGLEASAENDLDRRPSHHDAEGDHDHDDFTSLHVELPSVPEPGALLTRLTSIVREHRILRIKGFAAVTGKDMRLLVQGVGERFQHYYDRAWHSGERRVTRLVIIGETGLDEQAIRSALAG